ncbi:tyrosine-type recombinase/integrase [Actinoplanes sp. NPDC049316]|uniref:tyrosine-type recombinase/integrase n=1 Tax=Actinoplanes sp. NPDC049316 TaxID=3154727 RepID=UPI00341C0688
MTAEGLGERTREMYVDVGVLFAGWLRHRGDVDDWEDVGVPQLRGFFVWLQAGGAPCPHQLDPGGAVIERCEGYGRSYVNNVGRGLQQFYAWYAVEEQLPNPMAGFKIPAAPKPGEQLVPVVDDEWLSQLIRDAEASRDYASRRDAAVLRLLACTGMRLAEITGLQVADVDLPRREAVVTGKGRKQRRVRFDAKAALALDRYLRLRAKRLQDQTGRMAAEAVSALWIGHRRFVPMTEKGIYQLIVRRGEKIGIKVYPHMFRHTFSHRWLDAGGSEGDLMELNGWDSPQMLRHYGRSARSARARRSYDNINVMGDI